MQHNPLLPLQALSPTLPTVPQAFRAWALHANRCGGGCFQVKNIKLAMTEHGLTPDKASMYLAEVFSRATFEVLLGMHFDGIDSGADIMVFSHICELWDVIAAKHVRDLCRPCVIERGE